MSMTSKTAKGGDDLTSSDCIHDAEGIRPRAGDEFTIFMGSRCIGRIVGVRHTGDSFRPAAVVVAWNRDNRVGEIDPQTFEDCCRVILKGGC